MKEQIQQLKQQISQSEIFEKQISELKADNARLANIVTIQQESLGRALAFQVL